MTRSLARVPLAPRRARGARPAAARRDLRPIVESQRATIERLQATLDTVYLLVDRLRAVMASPAPVAAPRDPATPASGGPRGGDSLPLVLTLQELATIYRVSTGAIRRGLARGTFRPAPYAKYPYRWRRDDVLDDLNRPPVARKARPTAVAP